LGIVQQHGKENVVVIKEIENKKFLKIQGNIENTPSGTFSLMLPSVLTLTLLSKPSTSTFFSKLNQQHGKENVVVIKEIENKKSLKIQGNMFFLLLGTRTP
jgi:hypothetical protein